MNKQKGQPPTEKALIDIHPEDMDEDSSSINWVFHDVMEHPVD